MVEKGEKFDKEMPINGSSEYGFNMNMTQGEIGIEYDRLALPSEGKFYRKDVNGNTLTHVDVSYLTLDDESIMLSENLLRSGEMLDVLLRRKVKLPAGFKIDDLLIGDKIAILIWLRATMDPIYKLRLKDPSNGQEFDYDFNLTELLLKDISDQPDQNGEFSFSLKKSGKLVKFRLMTGADEKIVNAEEKSMQRAMGNKDSYFKQMAMMRQITYIEGIFGGNGNNDIVAKQKFIKTMPLLDSRELYQYMNDVMPAFDLNIVIPTPSGGSFRTILPFTAEFFYPSI